MNNQTNQNIMLANTQKPILVFGGSYGNLQATMSLLEIASSLSIPAGNIICTGDVVAYCGNPQETSELIRQAGIHVIKGNCEENLSLGLDDCGCGFDENSACDLLSAKWYNFCSKNLSGEILRWMSQLPDSLTFAFNETTFHVLHGSPTSINEFVFESNCTEKLDRSIHELESKIILCGHSGIPFSKKVGDKLWHNAGAIGMPANDGTQRGWYSLIFPEEDKNICIAHKALNYDYCSASQKMEEHGLIEYAKTLKTGIWPSNDVLPFIEAQKQGKPIFERRLTF